MGLAFMDAYSLLHFSVGVVARHWAMGFVLFLVIHTVFEWIENTRPGMNFINTYIKAWPGGKPAADSLLNNVGDTVFSALGWLLADYLLANNA